MSCEICGRGSCTRSFHSLSEQEDFEKTDEQRLSEAADRIETLERELAAAQAKIDALMLEYCPDEMTDAQREEWARHQVPVEEEGK